MPTDEDFDDLKAVVAALKQELGTTKTKLRSLEDFAATHIGMDWGTSNLAVNTPHPNISIDSGEFGGGRERLDPKGIQILANSGSGENIAIWGVPQLVPNPSAETRPKSYIAFNNDATTTTLKLRSTDGFGNTAQVYTFADDLSDSSGFRSDIDNDDTSGQTWVTHKTVNGQSWAVLELLNTTLRLASFAADPTGTVDGDMWYRSDLDVIRYQANSVVLSIGGGLLTDTAWAAAGDLVYGTGNDTATILTHSGIAGQVLTSTTAPNAMTWATPAGGSFSYGKAITTSQGQNLP